MNIFAPSDDPALCAEALDDKRVIKMVLETAQILCTMLARTQGLSCPYKPMQPNNKYEVWAGSDPAHAYWLLRHGFALDAEYTHRFNKRHAAGEVLDWTRQYIPRTKDQPETYVNGARHTKLGLDFTHRPVHAAYRAYLNARWPGDTRLPVWTNRQPPRWCTYVPD